MGGDPSPTLLPARVGCFNPRLRTGGDQIQLAHLFDTLVSIHASAREATCLWPLPASWPACFNPRLRTGGDRSGRYGVHQRQRFQSTPPHGRRPILRPGVWTCPTGFNPRLRTGGDDEIRNIVGELNRFNPRLRTGGDPTSNGVAPDHGRVSIHASAREATCVRRGEQVAVQSFNPRLRTGGDMFRARMAQPFLVFQSTPPHGRRLVATSAGPLYPCFNPRLRTGGDPAMYERPPRSSSFNPRLRTGGDLWLRLLAPYTPVSIHASAREATPPCTSGRRVHQVSIHASAREATAPAILVAL